MFSKKCFIGVVLLFCFWIHKLFSFFSSDHAGVHSLNAMNRNPNQAASFTESQLWYKFEFPFIALLCQVWCTCPSVFFFFQTESHIFCRSNKQWYDFALYLLITAPIFVSSSLSLLRLSIFFSFLLSSHIGLYYKTVTEKYC